MSDFFCLGRFTWPRAVSFLLLAFALASIPAAMRGAGGAHASAPASLVGSPPAAAPPSSQEPFPTSYPETPAQLSRKQQRDLLKHNFEKMKRDADELVELAKSLQQDLNSSSENVLSLKVVEKAEKIERLAKRIKGAAKGY